jgi:hypothetical protein
MTAFTKDNPGLTRLIVEGGAATAVLSTVGGTLLITTAGFKALGLAMQFSAIGGAPGLARTATQIGAVGGSLKFLAVGLGALGAAAAAWEVGKWAGKKIYDETADDSGMRWVGKGLAYTMAFAGDQDARDAVLAERRYDREKGNLAPAARPAEGSFLTSLAEKSRSLATVHSALATAMSRVGTSYLDPTGDTPTTKTAPLSASFFAPLATKFALPASATSAPTTQNSAPYMTTRQTADNTPRQINVVVDGRVIARAMDDQVNRATASGAGMGTTQFDPSFSVPPLSLPGGAK